MKSVISRAIVLRRINYQESGRIITFLTEENGKITALAKGVRKSNSKLAGSIEMFGTSQITYLPSRGEMFTLISARLIKNYDNIVKDLNRSKLAFGFLKVVDRNIEQNNGKEFYKLLEQAFEELNDLKIEVETIKFWFYIEFLDLMGYSPNVTDIEQSKNVTRKNYLFDMNEMNFIESVNGVYSLNQIKLFVLASSNKPKQLQRINGIDILLPEVNKLVVTIMRHNTFDVV